VFIDFLDMDKQVNAFISTRKNLSVMMGGKLEQGANSQGGQYAIRQG
jgi:hypothetical protein